MLGKTIRQTVFGQSKG